MDNQKPFLLGKICEVPKNKKKKVYKYTREELVTLAEIANIPITPQTSNNYLCETLRQIAIDNNLNTYEDFEKYPYRELKKYPSLNDYIMFEKDFNIIHKMFKNFDEIGFFNNTIQKLGINSNHGFLYKLNYILNGNKIDIILKSARKSSTDNLYHEYLAGLCINEFSKYFPFFPKTYKLGAYKDRFSWNTFFSHKGIHTLPLNVSQYIHYLDPLDFEENTRFTCQWSKYICVFMQYLNLNDTLHSHFYKYVNSSNVYNSSYYTHLTRTILMLYLIYKTLSQLADYFTHYDLHLGNIGIYSIPENKCITINIKLDNDIIQFKTNYLPIFIDFGRSFFNCQNLNASLNTSKTLMNSVCSFDNRNPVRALRLCKEYCGDDVGYMFTGIQYPDGTFSDTNLNDYYINRPKRNMSHDLRLINSILSQYNFKSLDKNITYIKQFIDLLSNINYEDQYGTKEQLQSQSPIINNVHDAANALENIIRLPEFKTDLEYMLRNKDPNSYGTLDLNFSTGHFEEFKFEKL